MKGPLVLLCLLVCVLTACTMTTPEPTVTATSTHTSTPVPTDTPTATATSTPSPTPTPSPECVDDDADAMWSVEVFANADVEGEPALTCSAAEIDFEQQVGYPFVSAFATDFVSSRWTSRQELEAGLYVFSARSDDGIRVVVDDEAIIDEWHDQSAKADLIGEVSLDAGEHTIVVEHYNGEGETRLSVTWESTPPTATPAPAAIAPTTAPAAPVATAAPTEADELAQWNPVPIRVDCLGGGLCGFIFTVTFSSKDYFHRLEFVNDAGDSVIMGIESTFRNFVALDINFDLKKNLQYGVPYRWRVLLYRPAGTGEELVKRGPLSIEPFVAK